MCYKTAISEPCHTLHLLSGPLNTHTWEGQLLRLFRLRTEGFACLHTKAGLELRDWQLAQQPKCQRASVYELISSFVGHSHRLIIEGRRLPDPGPGSEFPIAQT